MSIDEKISLHFTLHVYDEFTLLIIRLIFCFFSHVYNYCISNPSKSKSIGTTTTVGNNKNTLNRPDGANIVGGELYNKLKIYLQNYLDEICQVSEWNREVNLKEGMFVFFVRMELIYKVKMFYDFIPIVGRNINSPVKL